MGNFKKYWWKLLGCVLVAFSVVMSFTTPLAAGVAEVTPTTTKKGKQLITIKGYNAHFKSGHNRFWLTGNHHTTLIPGTIKEIINENLIKVEFDIPEQLPSNNLALAVQSREDGGAVLEAAVFVSDASILAGMTTAIQMPMDQKADHFTFPFKNILYETIRNLNFHVTMWFALIGCMLISMIRSIQHLSSIEGLKHDRSANEGVRVGLLFGFLGLITGSVWARFTWGAWWVNDTKLNGAAISVLIYLAYILLRNSISEEQKRARIVAVYNIFAFVMMLVFIMILPRLTDSLHPGNGGNPAFSNYDLDNNMRMIFYPAVLGWILIGAWMINLRSRMSHINFTIHNHE